MTTPTATHPAAADRSDPSPFALTGPLPTVALEVQEATWWEDDCSQGIFPAETCSCCPDPVQAHQYVVRINGAWMHTDCGQKLLDTATRRELLLTLASHISYNPSKHSAGMVRWVIRNLLRVIATMDQRTPPE